MQSLTCFRHHATLPDVATNGHRWQKWPRHMWQLFTRTVSVFSMVCTQGPALNMSGGCGLVVRSEACRTTVARPSLSRLRAVSNGPAQCLSSEPISVSLYFQWPCASRPVRLGSACAPGLIG
jgi:hypothetical protein